MKRNVSDYKKEITFLIDKQANIYYHKIDLMHDHEDLLIENGFKAKETQVCRLVYDPNQSDDCSFCGIPGVFASCNIMFDALPFELKNLHLNAIENWIKQYDSIIEYAETHAEEYKPDLHEYVRTMNRLFLLTHQEEISNKGEFFNCCEQWKNWTNTYPVLRYLNDKEEIQKLVESGLIGKFFHAKPEDLKEYLEDRIYDATEIYEKEFIAKAQSFIKDEVEESESEIQDINSKQVKIIKVKPRIDLARFLEVTDEVITDSGFPASTYFKIGANTIYSVITKIAERACEIKDEEILRLLQKLKMVEAVEGGQDNE